MFDFRVLALAAIIPISVSAQSLRCEIKEFLSLTDEGVFGAAPFPWSEDFEIIIDRTNGKIFHPEFGNENYPNRQVVDYGSSQSSLKIVSTSNVGSARVEGENDFVNWTIMDVHVYIEGEDKPFMATDTTSIVTGICR